MFEPFYEVDTATKRITDFIQRNLIELRFQDRSGVHADSFELALADDGSYTMPEEGKLLEVRFGYRGAGRQIRTELRIDQVESSGPPDQIQLSATAVDFATGNAHAPKERSHRNLTIGELVSNLAAEHGYTAMIKPAELGQVHLFHVDQNGLSDLALIHRVAREHNAMFKAVDGKWAVISYDLPRDPVIIRPGDITTWRAHWMPRNEYASVTAAYQDFDLASRVPVTAGEGEPNKILDRTFVDEPTARANAAAELARSRRDGRELTLRMPGRPDIASQSVLRLEGFRRDRVNDDWLVQTVVHTFNKRGYSTRVECSGV